MTGLSEHLIEIRRAMALLRRVGLSGRGLFDQLDRASLLPGQEWRVEDLIAAPDTGATLSRLMAPQKSGAAGVRAIRPVSPELPTRKVASKRSVGGVRDTAKVAAQDDLSAHTPGKGSAVSDLARREPSGRSAVGDPLNTSVKTSALDVPTSSAAARLQKVSEIRQRQRKGAGSEVKNAVNALAAAPTFDRKASKEAREIAAQIVPAAPVLASLAAFATDRVKAARAVSHSTVAHSVNFNDLSEVSRQKFSSAEEVVEGGPAQSALDFENGVDSPNAPNGTQNVPPNTQSATGRDERFSVSSPSLVGSRAAQPGRPRSMPDLRLSDTDQSLAQAAWRNGVEPQ